MMRCLMVIGLTFTMLIAGCMSHGSAAHLEMIRKEAARNEAPPGADPSGGERLAPSYWEEHAPLKYTLIALGVTTAVVLVAAAALVTVGAAEAKARSQWN